MAFTWLIFAVPVLLFAYRGFRQGIWVAATRIISLVVAYIVALLFSARLAPVLEQYTLVDGMAAYISAGLLLFFTTSLLLSLILSLLGGRGRKAGPSQLSAILGAVMGAGVGAVMGLVAVFAVSYLVEVWPGSGATLREPHPTAIERLARRSAKQVVTWVTSLGDVEPNTAKISAALVSEPRKVISHVQNLQQNPEARVLFTDPTNQAALRRGDINAIQRLPAFQEFMNNPDVQALMAVSGFDDGPETQAALAEQASKMWQRSEQLKNDQRVRAILDNPEFQQQLQSGNPAALLNNKDFMMLLQLLTSDLPASSTTSSNTSAPNKPNTADGDKSEPTIYRWVDAEGNVHYGDRQPAQ